MRHQLDVHNEDLREVINHPTHSLPFLQPGRLVKVRFGEIDYDWGCVVNFQRRLGDRGKALGPDVPAQESYIVDVLLNITSTQGFQKEKFAVGAASNFVKPCPPGEVGEFAVVPVLLSTLDGISRIRIFLPKDLKSPDARQNALKAVQEVKRRFPTGIPLLDPVENMGIQDEQFHKLLKQIETLESGLKSHQLSENDKLGVWYALYSRKEQIAHSIQLLKKKISETHNVIYMEDLKNRKRALRRLGFSNKDDVVEIKGRVACEISSGDELLLTEMIFNGAFSELTPEQCAALLSCFVFTEKVSSHGVCVCVCVEFLMNTVQGKLMPFFFLSPSRFLTE